MVFRTLLRGHGAYLLPITSHSHTQSRETWEGFDRKEKKGERKKKDGNYLSALAVQLEYRKSEHITEKLMRW